MADDTRETAVRRAALRINWIAHLKITEEGVKQSFVDEQIARLNVMPHDVKEDAYRRYIADGAEIARALGLANELHRETVHECPPDGSGIMPCCGRTPSESPTTDRLTANVNLVTCRG